MRTLLAAMLTLAVLGRTVQAGNTVSPGAPTKNEKGEIEIPVHLAVEVDLSCLSVVLRYDPSEIALTKDGLRLAPTRFPWQRRSVLVSVDPKQGQLVFTVADLVGRNCMVKAGDGPAFTIVGLSAGDSAALPSAPEVVKATAFDCQGNKVVLRVATADAE